MSITFNKLTALFSLSKLPAAPTMKLSNLMLQITFSSTIFWFSLAVNPEDGSSSILYDFIPCVWYKISFTTANKRDSPTSSLSIISLILVGCGKEPVIEEPIVPEEPKEPEVKFSEDKLAELKALHPLVTDVRFFKDSYFPDVILEEINVE